MPTTTATTTTTKVDKDSCTLALGGRLYGCRSVYLYVRNSRTMAEHLGMYKETTATRRVGGDQSWRSDFNQGGFKHVLALCRARIDSHKLCVPLLELIEVNAATAVGVNLPGIGTQGAVLHGFKCTPQASIHVFHSSF